MAEDSTRRSFGDDMLRPSPNHRTQQLPNDDDEKTNLLVTVLFIAPTILCELFVYIHVHHVFICGHQVDACHFV